MRQLFYSLLSITIVLGCNSPDPQKNETANKVEVPNLQNILPGLWSIDSANQLTNSGYLFQNDGTVEILCESKTGSWQTEGNKLIKIQNLDSSSALNSKNYLVDSLTNDRLYLDGKDHPVILRKVPYGSGSEQSVLSGFMGKLTSTIPEKSYPVTLPSSKKITLELKSEDQNLAFDVESTGKTLTSQPLRSWSSVIIIGGTFTLKIKSSNPSKLTNEGSEFDVKVFVQ